MFCHAEIKSRLFGGWRITTATAGDVEFSRKGFKHVVGGSGVYRAMVLAIRFRLL